MNEEHPVDIYNQRYSWSDNIYFELFPTRLRVYGKAIKEEYDVNFRLENLDPLPDKRWVVNPIHNKVTWVVMCSLVAMLFSYFALSYVPKVLWISTTLFAISTLNYFILPSKMEFHCFKYFRISSTEYAIAIGKVGPQRAHFDEFVGSLSNQIKIVNASNLFESTDPGSPE